MIWVLFAGKGQNFTVMVIALAMLALLVPVTCAFFPLIVALICDDAAKMLDELALILNFTVMV